jgi:hypothetical protein
VIVTGTRAYAVREDLRAHNRRLLDWVRGGGRMVVLYNTPEFVPDELAPYDGTLPSNAEEVSEQAAAVEILAPTHAFFTTPNRITDADFDGWIEQRGSKFFASWDAKLHAAAVEPRSGAAGAAGRMADRQRRQRTLDLHGLCAAPPGAVRRRRGV